MNVAFWKYKLGGTSASKNGYASERSVWMCKGREAFSDAMVMGGKLVKYEV